MDDAELAVVPAEVAGMPVDVADKLRQATGGKHRANARGDIGEPCRLGIIVEVDVEVIRDGVGKYRVQHQATQSTGPGTPYWYGFFANGGQIAAGENTFEVPDTRL